jgi:hypothetical protein
LRRQHLAMNTVFLQNRVLFPLSCHVPRTPYPTQANARLQVFNPLIAGNVPQLQAVVSIVKRPAGSVPFVIFGPYVSHTSFPVSRTYTFAILDPVQGRPSRWWKRFARSYR